MTSGMIMEGNTSWRTTTPVWTPKLSPAMGPRPANESRRSMESGFDKMKEALQHEDNEPTNRYGEGSFPSTDEPASAKPSFVERAKDHDMNGESDEEMGILRSLGNLEPTIEDEVAEMLLRELGSSGGSYKRERRQGLQSIVGEIYSPPRVNAELKRSRWRHLIPGLSLGLTVKDPFDNQPWDFRRADKRARARKLTREQEPFIVIGSPECTAFSSWQHLNETMANASQLQSMLKRKAGAKLHLDFVAPLCREQLEGGRYFLHEHPMYATSWKHCSIADLLELPGVGLVRGDQCQYGAEAIRGPRKGDPTKKPTGFLSNSPLVLKALSKQCQGRQGLCSRPSGRSHVPLTGQLAKDAAIYPRDLCRAMLKGVSQQLRADKLVREGCFGMQVPDDDPKIHKTLYGPAQGYSGEYVDDLTGQVLKGSLVQEARLK